MERCHEVDLDLVIIHGTSLVTILFTKMQM